MKLNEYLMVAKAMKFLGLSRNTLMKLCNTKQIPTYRHPNGLYRLFKQEDLEKYLEMKNYDDAVEINSFDESTK